MPTGARTALLSACVLWAVSFIATKVALESVPPLTVVTLRLAVSAACFVVWLAFSGRWRLSRWRHRLVPLFGLSLLGTGLHYGMQTIGLQFTTASNASLYAITGPITIVICAALFLGESVGRRKIAGIALAVAGVIVVMGVETLLALEVPPNIVGDLLVLGSIVMWGLFTVFGKRVTDELGALLTTSLLTIIGALWMAPVGWVEMWRHGFSLDLVTTDAWAAIGFLGVGCSFLATLLYFVALERAESQRVGVYLYTIPPMTAVIAALYLGEELGAEFVLGSVMVFAGVWLTESAGGA